jgi:hypothetical protein
MYYEFRQNNSGGHFEESEDVGITVIIEACCFAEAKEKAEEIGIYFDGVQKGMDCPCCGDRWSEWQDIVKLPTEESLFVKDADEKGKVYARLVLAGITDIVYDEKHSKLKFTVDTIEQYAEVFAIDDFWAEKASCVLHLENEKKVYI